MLMQAYKEHGDKMLSIPKALAYFLFRELVEDIHADGRISQAEMKELNRRAVNRAKLFLDLISDEDVVPFKLLVMTQNIYTIDWDEPCETEEIAKIRAFYRREAGELFSTHEEGHQPDPST
jgi:hypothetical protein